MPSAASTSISAVAAGTAEHLVKPRLPALSRRELTLISKGLWERHRAGPCQAVPSNL